MMVHVYVRSTYVHVYMCYVPFGTYNLSMLRDAAAEDDTTYVGNLPAHDTTWRLDLFVHVYHGTPCTRVPWYAHVYCNGPLL
jgi:hypothetical protein